MQWAMDDGQPSCFSSSSGLGTSERNKIQTTEKPRAKRARPTYTPSNLRHTRMAHCPVPKSLEEVGDQQQRQNLKKVLRLTRKTDASFQCPKAINNISSWSAAPHVRIWSTTKA
jgi:hypothetical protein